ncbi:MAG: hypothetical protein ACE5H9_06835 [Anaerolineae bacterium]
MLIEIGAPASLPLGLVRLDGDAGPQTCLLGITLQHPPLQLAAQAGREILIAGPRADKVWVQAQRFLAHHRLGAGVEVLIELAIPAFMGLSSETMLSLSIAQAAAWSNGLPFESGPDLARGLGLGPEHALQVWGFDGGGLLLVDTETGPDGIPALRRRREIAHKEKDAWAFVFLLPRAPDGTPETLGADRLRALLQAGPHLSGEGGRIVTEELWPAVENDDIAAFGRSLLTLQALNRAALAQAGSPQEIRDESQALLELMRDNGAVAWGQSLTGFGLYALVRGAKASVDLRKKLRDRVGFFGGTVMATITDNDGAQHVIKDESLDDRRHTPIRPRS